MLHQGFQTPWNKKSTRTAASCFHLFFRVWNRKWNLCTHFWYILYITFDSVWHEELFCKLLKTNIGGNLYNPMKSLYCNWTCSIKIRENKSQPFSHSIVNLYLNNLPHLFENTLSDPFVLPNGKKIKFTFLRRWFSYSLNLFLYLVLDYRSLNSLSLYCDKWKLKINLKKTKIMIAGHEARVGQSPIPIDHGQPLFLWLSRDWLSVRTYASTDCTVG